SRKSSPNGCLSQTPSSVTSCASRASVCRRSRTSETRCIRCRWKPSSSSSTISTRATSLARTRSPPVRARPSEPQEADDMSKHVTVAVIGAGMAGQAHAFGYRNVTMHPELAGVDVELSTIVDVTAHLARSVAGRYGFANASTDLDVVLADDSIDAVSVALPNFEYAN